jgi:Predicted oxidoreductases of the aldo/keto reductase family
MQYRVDKKSGNKLSVLGFGCMRLPGTMGKIDLGKTEELFLKAIEGGVNYFDTAYLYPGSEEALGQILEKHALRDKVFIATKLPQSMCQKAEDFDRFFDIQKKRLRTDHVDYYFMHNISDFKQWEKLVSLGIKDWIAAKKASGEIRRVGFSFHGSSSDFGLMLEAYDWDFCQIQYNYINTSYQAGTEGLKKAAALGLPVFIMEPLLGGKLVTGLPKQAEAALRRADAQRSNAAWALRWVWNQAEPTLLLSGMNAMEQLEENLALADEAKSGMMTATEAGALDEAIAAFRESYKVPCTGCNYCMPCPQKINIPALFTAYNASFAMGKVYGITAYLSSAGAFSSEPHYASSCVKCGACEKKCPQHIAIRDSLVAVSRRLEPFYLKPMMKLASKVMR